MGKHNYVIYSIFDASSLSVKKTESGSQRGYILGYYVCLVQDAVLVAVSSLWRQQQAAYSVDVREDGTTYLAT